MRKRTKLAVTLFVAALLFAAPIQNCLASGVLPVGEYVKHGVDGTSCKTYGGKAIYGIYDTNQKVWKLNTAYTSPMEKEPMLPPPEDAVCLLTVYDGSELIGFEQMSYDAFRISLPARFGGVAAFDEAYGRYKEYGFDSYSYDGRNVRGFWDEYERTSLVNIDPATGNLFECGVDDEYGTYIVAEYVDGKLVGIKEITAAEFAVIPGIVEHVEAIREQFFK